MPFNLHAIANMAIRTALPNVDMVVIRCTGFKNEYGQLIESFGSCERITAQKQTLNGDELTFTNEIMQAEIARKFFLSSKGAPLTAGRRHDQCGASYLFELDSGVFWKVYNISEDYAAAGWQLVFAAIDPTPPAAAKQALKDSGIGGPLEFDDDVCTAQTSEGSNGF